MSYQLFPGISLAALVLFGAGPVHHPAVAPMADQYTAHLSGANEQPAVQTMATGDVTLTIDTKAQSIKYTITVSNISDVTGAHIHLGKADGSGPPVFGLLAKPVNGAVNGTLISGTATAKNLMGSHKFADVVAQIAAGDAYVNIHTKAHAAGEIRGQLTKKTM